MWLKSKTLAIALGSVLLVAGCSTSGEPDRSAGQDTDASAVIYPGPEMMTAGVGAGGVIKSVIKVASAVSNCVKNINAQPQQPCTASEADQIRSLSRQLDEFQKAAQEDYEAINDKLNSILQNQANSQAQSAYNKAQPYIAATQQAGPIYVDYINCLTLASAQSAGTDSSGLAPCYPLDGAGGVLNTKDPIANPTAADLNTLSKQVEQIIQPVSAQTNWCTYIEAITGDGSTSNPGFLNALYQVDQLSLATVEDPKNANVTPYFPPSFVNDWNLNVGNQVATQEAYFAMVESYLAAQGNDDQAQLAAQTAQAGCAEGSKTAPGLEGQLVANSLPVPQGAIPTDKLADYSNYASNSQASTDYDPTGLVPNNWSYVIAPNVGKAGKPVVAVWAAAENPDFNPEAEDYPQKASLDDLVNAVSVQGISFEHVSKAVPAAAVDSAFTVNLGPAQQGGVVIGNGPSQAMFDPIGYWNVPGMPDTATDGTYQAIDNCLSTVGIWYPGIDNVEPAQAAGTPYIPQFPKKMTSTNGTLPLKSKQEITVGTKGKSGGNLNPDFADGWEANILSAVVPQWIGASPTGQGAVPSWVAGPGYMVNCQGMQRSAGDQGFNTPGWAYPADVFKSGSQIFVFNTEDATNAIGKSTLAKAMSVGNYQWDLSQTAGGKQKPKKG